MSQSAQEWALAVEWLFTRDDGFPKDAQWVSQEGHGTENAANLCYPLLHRKPTEINQLAQGKGLIGGGSLSLRDGYFNKVQKGLSLRFTPTGE